MMDTLWLMFSYMEMRAAKLQWGFQYKMTLLLYCPCLCCHSFLMCGLFELKQTCADFLLFVYNCIAVDDPIIKRRRIGTPFFGLILQHFCACPKQEPVHGLFCVQWFEMRGRLFVDSGGIVDNQFLLLHLPHIDWMSSTS